MCTMLILCCGGVIFQIERDVSHDGTYVHGDIANKADIMTGTINQFSLFFLIIDLCVT